MDINHGIKKGGKDDKQFVNTKSFGADVI